MYTNMLKNMIAEANITQEELSKKCKEMNAPISRGTINTALNEDGKVLDEKVSRAIAKICNADERELVLAGYLEKAPHEFIEFLNKEQDLMFEAVFPLLENILDSKQKETFKELFKKETLVESMIEVLDTEEAPKIPINLFETKIDNEKLKIICNELMFYTIKDDSMQEKIPKGSKLRIDIKSKYNNGDIVILKANGEKIVRMIIWIGKTIFAYPMNKNYQAQILNEGEYEILAKVRSVEILI